MLLFAITLPGCTQPNEAEYLLRTQGFKNIQVTGYNFFACSEDDMFHTGFSAIAPNGQRVSGTVCGGWLKGKTVRFD